MDELVGQSMNRYEILELLGEGGMGAVYRARDVTLQRDVAIKVLHRHISRQADFEARFLQEARSAARLDHPGIVQVYDFNQALGRLYIVMKLIAGANLRQMLEELKKSGKWVPLEEGVQLVRQVSLTLDYAHRKGVLHRDIKPQNIMIEPEPSDGLPYRPVITDLGLAKLAEGGLVTRQGSSIGTPAYMSPEQALGQNIDARSDVYSLGVLLYELSAGCVPFPARTITEAIRYHTKETPPPPRSIRPDLPVPLERIILLALEKDPAARFSDAATLANTLQGVLPVLAENTAAPTVRENAVSLITQYQHSLEKPHPAPRLKEFDTPAGDKDTIRVLVDGRDIGAIAIESHKITIGRKEDNDIIIEDPGASRYHARVEFDGKDYVIIDLNSRNGTYLVNTRLLPGISEVWIPEKALRIGNTWLHLVRARIPSEGITSPLKGSVADVQKAQTGTGQRWVGMVLETAQLAVEPGDSTVARISVLNQGPLVDHFQVSLDGIPAEWVSIPPSLIRLMPGQQQQVTLVIHPPKSPQSRAGQHPLLFRATSQNDSSQMAEVDAFLTVSAYHLFNLNIRPQKQTSLAEGTFTLHIGNQCNTSLTAQLTAIDPEDACRFAFDQQHVVVTAGQEQEVQFKVMSKVPLRGETSRTYAFTVTAQPAEVAALSQQVQGTWVQAPPAYEVTLRPQTQYGMNKGVFSVHITNLGHADVALRLQAMDTQGGCQYTFSPPQVTVPVGQERVIQLEVVPRTTLTTLERKTYPFTVTVQPAAAAGFIQQVQGEWVYAPPELELNLQAGVQNTATAADFSVRIDNRSDIDVTVQWEASGQDADCRYAFTPSRSMVPTGGGETVQLKINSSTPPPVNTAVTHIFTVSARLVAAPQLVWQTRGEWVRQAQAQTIQPITTEQVPASPAKNPRRVWGCLVMAVGVVLTIAFGLLLGNIAFEALGFDDTGAWVAAVIGWIIGVLITRSLARKVTKG